MDPLICPKCNGTNFPSSTHCIYCHTPLVDEAAPKEGESSRPAPDPVVTPEIPETTPPHSTEQRPYSPERIPDAPEKFPASPEQIPDSLEPIFGEGPVAPSMPSPEERSKQAAYQRQLLRSQMRGGASWFYWIAGLSIVNALTIRLNVGFSFIFGLGATQLVDALASALAMEIPELAAVIIWVAFAIDLLIAAVFVIFGVYANRGYRLIFIVGMLLYALDALFFLWWGDLLGFAFHMFALFGIYRGFRVLRELERIDATTIPA
jgi:hypothetical protein